MALDRLTKITGPGINTDTNWVGNNANFTGVTTTSSSFNVGVTTIHSNLAEVHNIKSTGIITATGGSFSGNVTAVDGTFSGNVSIAGTLTYEDVTNIDSVGIITANQGIHVGAGISAVGIITATSFVGALPILGDANNRVITATGSGELQAEPNITFDSTNLRIGTDNGNILIGLGADLSLVHDGSHSRIKNTTGTLFLQSDGIKLKNYASTEHYISCVDGGAVELYHNGTKRLETSSVGVSIPQDLDVDGHTNLDNVSIAGVTTSYDALHIKPSGSANSTNVVPLEVYANRGSTTTGISTVLYHSSYAIRPEFILRQVHNGNWNNSNGQTQHWRMLWKAPNETDTTDEVVELKPFTNIGGAFSNFGIRVTDNSTGLKNSAYFNSQQVVLYANNTNCLFVNQTGIGITDSIYHYGDTNTKIRFPAADTVSIETAGSERFRIYSDGDAKFSSKLGVGVEPVEYLDIRTTGSATALVGSTNAGGAYFKLDGDSNGDGSGGDYARLVHDTDGRFYIDNLKSTADIVFRNGASATERLRIDGNGNIGAGIAPSSGARLWIATNDNPFVGTRYNAGADGSVLFLQHSRSNTIGAGAALNDNDEIGAVQFRAFASDNSTIKAAALIKAEVNGTTGSGGVPTDLIFGTGTSSSNASEKLRIASDGVITAQKSATFGNTSDSFTAVNITSSTSGISELRFADTTANAGYVKYEHSNDALILATGTTERLRIESWGGIHNNQTAIYGGGVANEPTVHFNGSGPSNDLERGHLAVSHNAAYNASPIARIALTTRYNSSGGYTFMGGIEGGKANTTDNNFDGFVRLVVRKHGQGNIERLRITSTGRINAGLSISTDPWGATGNVNTGVRLVNADGGYAISANSKEIVGIFNRTNTAGSILEYKYNGNVVGSVITDGTNLELNSGASTKISAGGSERLSINSSGYVGINSATPAAYLDIGAHNTGNPTLRVRNHTSAGAYSGNYGSEFRHSFNSANHAMLIHTQEAADARRVLDISDSNGIFATFTNGKFGVGTVSPVGKLHISSGTSGDCKLIIEADTDNNAEGDNPQIEFRQDGGVAVSAIGHGLLSAQQNGLVLANGVSNGYISFATGTTDGHVNATERFRITPKGDVCVNNMAYNTYETAGTNINTMVDNNEKRSGVYWINYGGEIFRAYIKANWCEDRNWILAAKFFDMQDMPSGSSLWTNDTWVNESDFNLYGGIFSKYPAWRYFPFDRLAMQMGNRIPPIMRFSGNQTLYGAFSGGRASNGGGVTASSTYPSMSGTSVTYHSMENFMGPDFYDVGGSEDRLQSYGLNKWANNSTQTTSAQNRGSEHYFSSDRQDGGSLQYQSLKGWGLTVEDSHPTINGIDSIAVAGAWIGCPLDEGNSTQGSNSSNAGADSGFGFGFCTGNPGRTGTAGYAEWGRGTQCVNTLPAYIWLSAD